MDAPLGVPVQPTADRCLENLAVSVAQGERPESVGSPSEPSELLHLGGLGEEDRLASCKGHRRLSSFDQGQDKLCRGAGAKARCASVETAGA